ncbi:MAG: hypothetical protein R3E48_16830 [Burkholderiaceae bacterium]
MVHTLVLLGVASVLLAAGEPRRGGVRLAGNTLAALLTAARATLVNPVVLPLIAGVLWSLSGLVLPAMIDRSLALLGAAAVPVAWCCSAPRSRRRAWARPEVHWCRRLF